MRFLALFFVGLIFPTLSHATLLNLPTITQGDFNNLVKELSADMGYYSVTPASSLGAVWGAELGVVAGITNTPDIQTLVASTGSTTNVSKLPHAGVLGRLGVPFGITGELLFLPTINSQSVNFREIGGAVQWTFTDLFLTEFPFTLAIKGYFIKTHLDYSQSISNSTTGNIAVSSTINFDDKIWGGQFLFSKKFAFFEPFGSVGFVNANGTLGINTSSGSGTILGFSIPGQASAQSANSTPSSFQLLGGMDFRLGFFSLGAEAERSFNRNTYTGRLSFRF